MKLYRPVFITSSPNTQSDDVWLSLKTFLQPWNWNNKKWADEFRHSLFAYLDPNGSSSDLMLFDSGRSAWYFFLKTLNITRGDEVILPAFTCLAVGNPVVWAGAKPIYVDVEIDSFNMDLDKLAAKITDRTKAIVIQHTFGAPVDMAKVRKIVGKRKILIVEDCAHALGGKQDKVKLGVLGDASFFGFGIDKAISGVRGGALLINFKRIKDKGFNIDQRTVSAHYDALPKQPTKLTWTSLLNPVIWAIATPLYFIGFGSLTIGRLFIRILYLLGIIGNVVDDAENVGEKPNWMPAKMSPALARLASLQLKKLDLTNAHRKTIAQIYARKLGLLIDKDNGVYQKYSFLVKDSELRKKIYNAARDEWFIIGDWLPRPLYAKFSSTEVYKSLCYIPQENPHAETVSQRIINLPTGVNIDPKKAEILSLIIKKYI